MTIPAPLAFPPTSLRNISAGLVVGNPIGSSGTRAKALTSAELKAIVEASGISYLPLAGGTLTGPITGTGGLIEQRDGLTAQCLDIFETYTSGTNNGKLRFKATSSGHQIGSARATSGSNRAVQLGHFDSAGTFTSGLSVATDGITTLGTINITSLRQAGATSMSLTPADGVWYLNGSAGLRYRAVNLGLATVFQVGDTGQLFWTPPTSITLSSNGLFSVEMTSNTAGNLVYRGSDGTTRRMALTFS